MHINNRFPEDLYPPVKDISKYYATTQRGYDMAGSLTLQIVGLAYNCGRVIARNIARCVELGSFFKDYSIHIVESNSTDNTAEQITGPGVRSTILSGYRPLFDPVDPTRFQYMSDLRNRYLDDLKVSDYVLVYDFDIEGGFSYDGIMHSVACGHQVTAANGITYTPERKFYDYLALVPKGKQEGSSEYANLIFDRGSDPIPVRSAFGGASLSKYNSIVDKRYDGHRGCEHNSICFGCSDIVLNPNFLVLYGVNQYDS